MTHRLTLPVLAFVSLLAASLDALPAWDQSIAEESLCKLQCNSRKRKANLPVVVNNRLADGANEVGYIASANRTTTTG